MPSIREASKADVKALAVFAERSFRDTFAKDNSASDMDTYCCEKFGEDIQANELCADNALILIAEHSPAEHSPGEHSAAEHRIGENRGELVAYAQLSTHAPKHMILAKAPAELQRLYVAKEWHGKGLAHEIMLEVFQALRLVGNDVLWLSVWEHNPKAMAFYQKYGFEQVGDHVFQLGSDQQRDLVMQLTIPA